MLIQLLFHLSVPSNIDYEIYHFACNIISDGERTLAAERPPASARQR